MDISYVIVIQGQVYLKASLPRAYPLQKYPTGPCENHAVTTVSLVWRLLPFLIGARHIAPLYKLRNQGGIHKGHWLTGIRHIVP